jgi:serine/threonine-protein kinase
MSLASGARLGVYRVESLLGAGGMGEVYLARDTRLDRDVALKVLPDLFAADPDRLARFEREARVLASLRHPNIAGIYGLEEADGVRALVLELVDGETLADRIARETLPLQEALGIARQIADALAAAHEAGIVHRDLKPANIKITSTGSVKVLDFGLAKALEAESVRSDLSMSPTLTSPAATRVGVLLGTAAYMSPEQARGKAVDRRSDLWAFGCVLYEMLTGRHAFEGDEITDVIARIIERDVDLRALPPATPPSIRRLLRRCLEKDRNRRLADASDARLEIDEALGGGPVDANLPRDVPAAPSAWQRALPWAIAGAALVVAGASVLLWAPWRSAPPSAPLRLGSELGVDASLVPDQGASAVLSPDGALLAFTAQKSTSDTPQLYVRRLDQLQPAPLAGTDGARNPFFSPDGQWIAYFAGGKLKKTAVAGGATVTLCDAPNGRGGTWTDDGTIIFSPNNTPSVTLMRVPAAGGNPEPLFRLAEGETTQRWPQVLPGGKAILYSSAASLTGWEDANLVIQPLAGGPGKIVVRAAYYGRYLPSGHLVYVHQGTMFAAPFDLERLEVLGPPVPVVEDVAASPAVTGGAQFAFSGDGTLIYVPGRTISQDIPISWIDRSGRISPLRAMPSNWSNPVFSPDGTRLAVDIFDGKQTDVWIYDWSRDTLSRLTFDQTDDQRPAWTSDGQRIVFSSKRGDGTHFNLYWQRADGTGDVTRLTDSTNNQYAGSWHPAGKVLAFLEDDGADSNIMLLPMEGDEATGWKPGTPTAFLKTPLRESTPTFSPDGRWIAYLSNENGRNDLFVRPFPGPGGKWQISTTAVDDPMWSRSSRELFFAVAGLQLMVAAYSVDGDSFRADKPKLVSETRFITRPREPSRDIAVHPDGQRFAVAAMPETEIAERFDKVVFVFNFLDELRRIASSKK